MKQDTIQFDRDKFKEAVWAVVAYCPPEELGNVKLHKILYFADMLTFLNEGRPMTGVEYLKQKFGPTARHLTAAVNELVSEGRLSVAEVDYFGFFKKEYRALGEPAEKRLSESEQKLIRDVADYFRGTSAKEISELSHKDPWKIASMGEVIPYSSALRLVPVEIKDSDREWALENAQKYAAEPWASDSL